MQQLSPFECYDMCFDICRKTYFLDPWRLTKLTSSYETSPVVIVTCKVNEMQKAAAGLLETLFPW